MDARRFQHGCLLFGTCLIVLQLGSPAFGMNMNLTLYYEGLCPDCRDFILDQLFSTYTKLEQYMNLDLVPFGNADMKVSNGTVKFRCQHGPDECYVNKVQTCGVKYVHPTRKLLALIACMFSQDEPAKAGLFCAQKVDTDWGVLERCSSGPEGTQLLYEMGKRTRGHKPDIEYVPYVEINDFHNETVEHLVEKDLFQFTCDLLEPHAPRVCEKKVSGGHCFRSNPLYMVRG